MRRYLFFLFLVFSFCFVQTSEARKLALLVGVDKYDDVPSLTCCVNDVKVLKDALMKVGFQEDDIQILATGSDDYPTKKRIERKLREIFEMAGPHDMVFLSFSGHGAQDGKKVYFCPPDVDVEDLDGTCVSIDQVMRDLEKCKAQFKWVVVDACRNDPADAARSIGGKGLQVIPTPPAGIALFQSCAKGEQSWEDRASGNGFFTKNFAAALSGEADANHDGQLTLMEVCTWTTAQTKAQVMASQNKSQKPYFSGTFSDFVLMENLNVPKAQTLAAEAKKAYDSEKYALAIEKYDAALALCPQFEYWKRERDSALKLLRSKPTSQDSFEYERGFWRTDKTKITKFIGKETYVVIPEGVKEIKSWAFYNCSSLKFVVIPKGVTKIEKDTFSDCSSLTSIVIPEGVREIGDSAFSGCSSLTSIVIPEDVREIGDSAFSGCSSLTSIVIPEGVREIGDSAFSGCSSLTSIAIPEGVREIGDSAFSGCSSLKSIIIRKGVMKIDSRAFSGCSSLTSILIPESVSEIEGNAFDRCPALKGWAISSAHSYFKRDGIALLTKDGKKLIACPGATGKYMIPKGVTEIGENAFYSCDSLTSVVIPEGVTKIGKSAFSMCDSLTSIVIPNSVKEIEGGAFAGCQALKKWSISSSHPHFKSDGIALLTKDGKKLIACLNTVKEYQIPEGVMVIEDKAFSGCTFLTSVIIPKSVRVIGQCTFISCMSLQSVVIPEGVTKIEMGTFADCRSLTSVVILEGVTEIGECAFSCCSSLTSVEIPRSVTTIGISGGPPDFFLKEDLTFDLCPNLTIYAPKGSVAEIYAKENKIPFKAK